MVVDEKALSEMAVVSESLVNPFAQTYEAFGPSFKSLFIFISE